MAKKKVKAYTEEFRKQAVSLADQPGKTAVEVAESLGIHVNQIYNWRTQFSKLSKKQFQIHEGVDYAKEESIENKRLKHENAALRKEVEFLKKAAAYFANQNK
jgi:transposase